jgi:porphobilinogen synthase
MILDIPIRLRRNRKSEAVRSLIQETRLTAQDLVAQKQPIASMPHVYRWSIDLALQEAIKLHQLGIQAIALFPQIDPSLRSINAEEAWNEEGLLAQAIRTIKRHLPSLCLIADVALDPFTSHGHDGLIDETGEAINDETIECLVKMALMQARAGIDFIAPSDMMDGRVKALRAALDAEGFFQVGIIAYSAKYASSLYGPFREALHTKLTIGNKKGYQLNPANQREALLEATFDEKEGADILLVKPATLYLDIICELKKITYRPIAAYHVSGEYAMIMAAHEKGWLNGPNVLYETLLSIKRAGADLIFTYGAEMVIETHLR